MWQHMPKRYALTHTSEVAEEYRAERQAGGMIGA